MSGDLYVTPQQLQYVAAGAAALREVLGITLIHNWERRREGSFLFGIEEDVPGTPHLHLVHMDYGGGNMWSGEALDVDVITVMDAHHDGAPVDLRFVTMFDTAAGRLYEVETRSLPEEIRGALERAWTDALQSELPVPTTWTWLLAPADEQAAQGRTIG